jgi:DNA-binding beta-propeller fold protein YncE
LSEFSSAGVPLSPAQGYTGGGLSYPQGLGIDGAGNVWVANFHGSSISEFSNEGNPISPSSGYTGAGLAAPDGLAIDGSGDVWVAPSSGNNLVEFIGVATPVVTPLAVGVKNNELGARP